MIELPSSTMSGTGSRRYRLRVTSVPSRVVVAGICSPLPKRNVAKPQAIRTIAAAAPHFINQPTADTYSSSLELEIDKRRFRAGLQKASALPSCRKIRLRQRAVPRTATEPEMLDDDRKRVQKRKIVEQFCRVRVRCGNEQAVQISDRVIKVGQLEEDPEQADAQKDGQR